MTTIRDTVDEVKQGRIAPGQGGLVLVNKVLAAFLSGEVGFFVFSATVSALMVGAVAVGLPAFLSFADAVVGGFAAGAILKAGLDLVIDVVGAPAPLSNLLASLADGSEPQPLTVPDDFDTQTPVWEYNV